MRIITEQDDLKKVQKDKDFVNCNQDYEIDNLLKQGYSQESIDYCCKQDLGNNPREKFINCLQQFEKGAK